MNESPSHGAASSVAAIEMPSPRTSVDSLPSNGVEAALHISNGGGSIDSVAAHHVPSPSSNGFSTPLLPAQITNGTMEEKKVRAKAIVAATTSPADAVATEISIPSEGSSPASMPQINGSSPSRKRSRSGTRLGRPSQDSEAMTMRTRETVELILHEQYVHREAIFDSAKHESNRLRETTTEQRAQSLRYFRDEASLRRLANSESYFGAGYNGYGNDIQINKPGRGRQTQVVYPASRKRPGGRTSKELRVDKKEYALQMEQIDDLVPIRLDIEWDKMRLRDTFTWNMHDRVVDTEAFAQQLVEDFQMPVEVRAWFAQRVRASIEEQIRDHHPHIFIEDEPLNPHLPYFAYKNDEMRIVIKLNITIGQHTLMDQFEWDINNANNVAEDFAAQMTKELALSGEFTTAIAHSIREQCQLFTRSLYITGHPFDGRPIEDQELKDGFLPSPLPSLFRPYQATKAFSPYLFELNDTQMERTELSLSREERRQKRSTNRRGGPALPDLKDRRRSIRTLVISSVLPAAAEGLADSGLYKRTAIGKGRRGLGQRDDLDDSDESETDESSSDSPALTANPGVGTARTRGMRGAASAAQVAMRATIGRSATPESVSLPHHEVRASGRRVVAREYREDSSPDPPTTYVVKLKLGRQRFQQFLRQQRAKSKDDAQRPSLHSSPMTTAAAATSGAMRPPSATKTTARSLSEKSGVSSSAQQSASSIQPTTTASAATRQAPASTSQLGRIDAQGPPGPEHPMPSPPAYLSNALGVLRQKYPLDSFEGTMRYTAVSMSTDEPISLRPDAPPPAGTKFCYYPRIRCMDCPGKLYTPGPDTTVENFEVHLKNRHHRERVAKRVEGTHRDGEEGTLAVHSSQDR